MSATEETVARKPKRTKVSFTVWISPELQRRFGRFLDSLEFKPTITEVGVQMLEEFLRKRGF